MDALFRAPPLDDHCLAVVGAVIGGTACIADNSVRSGCWQSEGGSECEECTDTVAPLLGYLVRRVALVIMKLSLVREIGASLLASVRLPSDAQFSLATPNRDACREVDGKRAAVQCEVEASAQLRRVGAVSTFVVPICCVHALY